MRGAGQGVPHMPALHAEPSGQVTPQPPQLRGSLWVSTQPAPQSTVGGSHRRVHIPSSQTLPSGHRTPQPPQLRTSLEVSTHSPPQSTVGGMQRTSTQRPLVQSWPSPQARPQAPQFSGSLLRSSQPVGHREVPPMQGEKHMPRPQISPGPQRSPEPPQLAGSMRKSVHAPLHSTSGGRQESTQEPNWQS